MVIDSNNVTALLVFATGAGLTIGLVWGLLLFWWRV